MTVLAVSHSGLSPGKAVRIISPRFFPGWQAENVCYPFVIYDEQLGKYRMYYAGSGTTQVNDSVWDQWMTGMVTSTDTLTWSHPDNYEQILFAHRFLEGDVVDSLTEAGIFDSIFAYGACVIQDCSGYKAWYTGWNGEIEHAGGGLSDKTTFRIGYATSPDGTRWTKVSGSAGAGAVLGLGDAGQPDSKGVAHPHVLHTNNGYRMWYEGYDGTSSRIMHAASVDGQEWAKKGVALNLGKVGALDELGLRNPVVIMRKGQYELWYQGKSRSMPNYHVLRATSSDGMAWTKVPGEVVLHPDVPV